LACDGIDLSKMSGFKNDDDLDSVVFLNTLNEKLYDFKNKNLYKLIELFNNTLNAENIFLSKEEKENIHLIISRCSTLIRKRKLNKISVC
jgi:hypothetical protein